MAKGIYQEHYTNEKLLAAKDANGEMPGVYFLVSAGRSLGKTFSFCKTLWERFERTGEKFILLTRHKYQLGGIAQGVMKGYLQVERPNVQLSETIQLKGVYSTITAQVGVGEDAEKFECGYVIPLKSATDIKLVSSTFVDAWCLLFDEFQPLEDGVYLPDEVQKLQSIHKSVARGNGQMVRYMPCFMLSNAINIFNPYFVRCGLVGKIQPNTRLYRGDGYIYERCKVEGAAEKQASDPFERVWGMDVDGMKDDNSWLATPGSITGKPDGWGQSVYICTIRDGRDVYGVRYYSEVGLYYVDTTHSEGAQVYATRIDGELNVPFIKRNKVFEKLRKAMMSGQIRVRNSAAQSMILSLFQ